MPKVGKEEFEYTPEGMAKAESKSAQTGEPVIRTYDAGGRVQKTPGYGQEIGIDSPVGPSNLVANGEMTQAEVDKYIKPQLMQKGGKVNKKELAKRGAKFAAKGAVGPTAMFKGAAKGAAKAGAKRVSKRWEIKDTSGFKKIQVPVDTASKKLTKSRAKKIAKDVALGIIAGPIAPVAMRAAKRMAKKASATKAEHPFTKGYRESKEKDIQRGAKGIASGKYKNIDITNIVRDVERKKESTKRMDKAVREADKRYKKKNK